MLKKGYDRYNLSIIWITTCELANMEIYCLESALAYLEDHPHSIP